MSKTENSSCEPDKTDKRKVASSLPNLFSLKTPSVSVDKDQDIAKNKRLCGCNIALLSLDIILFCWYGAAACLLPYMTLHMYQLGLSVEEIALIYALIPVTQIMGPPLAGMVADKLGRYKPVLIISLLLAIVSGAALQFVPATAPPLNEIDWSDTPDDDYLIEIKKKFRNPANYSSHALTFWLYFVLRLLFQIFVGIGFTLLDATTLVLVEEHQSDYGKERFWAILATGITSPLCGLWIDQVNGGRDRYEINYAPAFILFHILVSVTAITCLVLDFKVAPPPPNMFHNVKPLLKSPLIWIFLIVVFICGCLWGFVESFLFLYLEDLHAPKYLLGLTLTVGALVGLPFLRESSWFVEKAGRVNLLILALVFYAIRYLGYSFIMSPWWCMLFEAMEAFTYHLMWVAAATYAAQISPPGLIATIQGLVGGLHYGVGKGAGSMVGGAMMAALGTRMAFRIMGYVGAVTAVLYTVLYYGIMRGMNCDKLFTEKRSTTKVSREQETQTSTLDRRQHLMKRHTWDTIEMKTLSRDSKTSLAMAMPIPEEEPLSTSTELTPQLPTDVEVDAEEALPAPVVRSRQMSIISIQSLKIPKL